MSESSSRQRAELGPMPPRVRIAPSPTGDPHVGTAYIALFNYVFAHKYGGTFILRIEDTDQQRSSQSSESAIFSALRWLGLDWHEGPDVGGPYGPYRQSERTVLYQEHAKLLMERGGAYRCFCTAERLEALRKQQMADGENPGYDGHCRDLSPEREAEELLKGTPFVVRLRVPVGGITQFVDQLRGVVEIANAEIGDQVLLKSDGFPTYHLANVVDDHLMKITHVIRGEDWITSTPKHVLLYRYFGWEPPLFFHLGLLRNEDRSKLSKRKNPVSVFHYRDLGYLPRTFLNFLGTLGFSMPGDRERFSIQDMIEAFDWSRVGTGGPVFDVRKLEAWNGDDIRAMTPEALLTELRARVLTDARLLEMVKLSQERIARLDDFVPYASFFFGGSVDYEAVLPSLKLKQRTKKEVVGVLKAFLDELEKDPHARAFDVTALEVFCRDFCERHAFKPKEFFTLLRLGASGRTASPPLFDTLVLMGKDRVRMRLRDVIERLQRETHWPG